MRILGRAVAFCVVLAIILLLVSLTDGEYSHVARHFLSNLFRQMF